MRGIRRVSCDKAEGIAEEGHGTALVGFCKVVGDAVGDGGCNCGFIPSD